MIIDKTDPNFEYTEEVFQYMIDNHIEFDREDIYMFFECCEIDVIPAEYFNRWTRDMTTICKVFDKYYAVDWEQGLNEMQEDLFDNTDIIEVYPIIREERRLVTDWTNKENRIIGTGSAGWYKNNAT